jgi:hypothetical protein
MDCQKIKSGRPKIIDPITKYRPKAIREVGERPEKILELDLLEQFKASLITLVFDKYFELPSFIPEEIVNKTYKHTN